MYTQQKQHLVIRNVCSNTHLRSYLEQICKDEKVNLVEQYVDSYTWLKPEPTLYDKLNAKPSFDIVLESYSQEKLRYIEYLYNKYEKSYRYTRQFVDKTMKESELKNFTKSDMNTNYTIGEIKVDITQNDINKYISNTLQDELTESFKKVFETNSEYFKGGLTHCSFRAPDARKQANKEDINKWISGNWTVNNKPQKKSKFQVFKQKFKDYWNINTVANIAIGLNFIFLVILLTIINNVVK